MVTEYTNWASCYKLLQTERDSHSACHNDYTMPTNAPPTYFRAFK